MSNEPVTPAVSREAFTGVVESLPASSLLPDLSAGAVPRMINGNTGVTESLRRRIRPQSPGVALACARCDLISHVATGAVDRSAVCEHCGEPLFRGRILDLNAANFGLHVSASHLPTLVVFWAPWCKPCHTLLALAERAARQLEPRIRIARVNTDSERVLVARHAVRGIPTAVLFRRGREVARRIGSLDMEAIDHWARA